jgi:outer membrane protein
MSFPSPKGGPKRLGLRWGALPLVSLAVATSAGVARAETLSAEQAVSRAAQNNPSLRAALLDSRAAGYAVAAERGARDPNFVASVQAEHSETIARPGLSGVANGSPDAASRSVQNAVSANAAVSYRTDIGTQLELGTKTGTSWNSNTWTGTGVLPDNLNLGPTYDAQAYLSARQPLLRGAGSDVELAPLHQAEAAARAAQSRHQDSASQTALDVLSAYWALWYADRAVDVQEQALAVAQRQVSDAKLRAGTLGTGSSVDVLQFTTNAASIADSLSQARADRGARAIELGRVLGMSPQQAASLDAEGTPPDYGLLPAVDTLTSEVDDTPALIALRADVERARLRVGTARNATKPRLDVFANASVGTLWDQGSDFSLSGGRPTYGVLGGLELELPLGGGRYSADAAAAQADLEAAEARYQAELDAARARVSSLAVNVQAAADQVKLTSETATAANQLAEAERQRLNLGTTTSRDVVTAEQTLREAELRRLRAVVDQASARFELEHTAGTLLDHFAGVAATSTGRSS